VYDFEAINLFGDPVEGKVNARWALGFPNKPWKGYDESVEARVPGGYRGDPESVAGGFSPMLPRNGPKAYRVARIEQDLAEIEERLKEALVPRARFHATLSKHAYESWLAQLRDKPGAIPEAAGSEYTEWVAWLRAHDPDLGGDPHFETTEDDRRRTEEAVERHWAVLAEAERDRKRRLEERGVWKGSYPGKENDPRRLPG